MRCVLLICVALIFFWMQGKRYRVLHSWHHCLRRISLLILLWLHYQLWGIGNVNLPLGLLKWMLYVHWSILFFAHYSYCTICLLFLNIFFVLQVMYAGSAQARAIIREYEFYFPKKLKKSKKKKSSQLVSESKQDRIKFDVLLTSYEMINMDTATMKSIKWECMVRDLSLVMIIWISSNISLDKCIMFMYRLLMKVTVSRTRIQSYSLHWSSFLANIVSFWLELHFRFVSLFWCYLIDFVLSYSSERYAF